MNFMKWMWYDNIKKSVEAANVSKEAAETETEQFKRVTEEGRYLHE